MEIPTKEDQELIVLARRLPVKDDFRNWRRIHHAKIFGHVLIVRQEGRIVGFAELYRMRYAPDYPVKPWPKDDPEGKVLYCYAAVCEKGFIRELINLAHRTFPGKPIEHFLGCASNITDANTETNFIQSRGQNHVWNIPTLAKSICGSF